MGNGFSSKSKITTILPESIKVMTHIEGIVRVSVDSDVLSGMKALNIANSSAP